MERLWFKGDTHLHTTNSDGGLHQYELIDRCKKSGLDWIIITDHNFNTVDSSYSSDGLNVIQGQEVTGELGHVNVWGAEVPVSMPYDLSGIESYKSIMSDCKNAGATICVNHPFCSMCGFHMDIDNFPMDCVEVWNTIQHSDNIKNMNWWVGKLKQGIRIAAVGGSDYHRDYAGHDILAHPTTITHAKSNTPHDILEALREGRSVITNTPNTSMLYLSVEEAQLGDTIRLEGNHLVGRCRATKLLPFYTLKVFNNDTLVYTHTASMYEKEHNAVFEVKQRGYVRAEIDYALPNPLKKVFSFAETKFLGAAPGPVPTFYWAFTNPIWID